jgi:hypothetical protein
MSTNFSVSRQLVLDVRCVGRVHLPEQEVTQVHPHKYPIDTVIEQNTGDWVLPDCRRTVFACAALALQVVGDRGLSFQDQLHR